MAPVIDSCNSVGAHTFPRSESREITAFIGDIESVRVDNWFRRVLELHMCTIDISPARVWVFTPMAMRRGGNTVDSLISAVEEDDSAFPIMPVSDPCGDLILGHIPGVDQSSLASICGGADIGLGLGGVLACSAGGASGFEATRPIALGVDGRVGMAAIADVKLWLELDFEGTTRGGEFGDFVVVYDGTGNGARDGEKNDGEAISELHSDSDCWEIALSSLCLYTSRGR